MKNIKLYQEVIAELLKREIDFRVDNKNDMIQICDDLYFCVEVNNFDEAVGYSVGARLRETDFDLEEVNAVVDFIQTQKEEIESE